jgi:indole-3-glycerol phosphate synthase
MTILDKIALYKRQEIAQAKARISVHQLQTEIANCGPPLGFRNALIAARKAKRYGLIAEIKKASPSKGVIRENFDPRNIEQLYEIARAYKDGGATCLSVLTDGPSFQGDLSFLFPARTASNLPALRKDFMLDPYQVVEARAFDADCILVILALVDDAEAKNLMSTSKEYGMDVLVEVHDETELDRAIALGADIIGINNRDLRTFVTDLGVTLRLAPHIPKEILVVAESGLGSPTDLKTLADAGVTTFLIGESLMRQPDVAAATRALIGATLTP